MEAGSDEDDRDAAGAVRRARNRNAGGAARGADAGHDAVTEINATRTEEEALMDRIGRCAIVTMALVVGGSTALAPPAAATYPGSNGRIAYHRVESATNVDIWTIDPDGSDPTNLTTNSPRFDVIPNWSPDGRRIVFVSRRDGAAPGDREIYVMNADGSNQTRLTNLPGRDDTPTWSPDGQRIAFTSTRDGDFEIFTMNADGTDVKQITNNTGFDATPEYSPDGAKIVFESDASGVDGLHVMNADGTHVRRLTDADAQAFGPDWSPFGNQIAFANNCCVEENSDIFVIKASGKKLERLTHDFDNNTFPTWSPDGQLIAFDHGVIDFEAGVFDQTDIWVMNADGTERRNVTNTPEVFEVQADWGPG
jgi:tol-pal system beta propeller repeat protein TolB